MRLPIPFSTTLAATLFLSTSLVRAEDPSLFNQAPGSIDFSRLPKATLTTDQLCADLLSVVDTPKKKAMHNGVLLEEACKNLRLGSDRILANKCRARNAGTSKQAVTYCEAKENARKAKAGLTTLAAIDLAAAGICFMEATSKAVMGVTVKGACGWGAIGAGGAEMTQVAIQLKHSIASKDPHSGRDSGNYISDDYGTRKKEKAWVNQLATAAPLAVGIIEGRKYFGFGKCDGSGGAKLKNPPKIEVIGQDYEGCENVKIHTQDPLFRGGVKLSSISMRNQPCALKNAQARTAKMIQDQCQAAQRQSALRIGILMSYLGAKRAINFAAADKTAKTVERALLDVLNPEGSTAVGGPAPTVASFQRPVTSDPTASGVNVGAITARNMDPEAFESVFLNNNPLGDRAAEVATKLGFSDPNKFQQALEQNGGPEGLVASIASSLGGNRGEVLASLSELKPYMIQEESGSSAMASTGGGMGGGKSESGDGMNLNLGALMGEGGAAAPTGEGVTEDAFRSPARAVTIFHEDTPLNIFQIVSGKIEQAQKDSRVPQ